MILWRITPCMAALIGLQPSKLDCTHRAAAASCKKQTHNTMGDCRPAGLTGKL